MRYFISERPSRQVHHIQGLKKENLDAKSRRDIYSGRFPPKKCSNRKTGKNLKEDFMKKEGKRGEKKKKEVIKHTLKYLYEA